MDREEETNRAPVVCFFLVLWRLLLSDQESNKNWIYQIVLCHYIFLVYLLVSFSNQSTMRMREEEPIQITYGKTLSFPSRPKTSP